LPIDFTCETTHPDDFGRGVIVFIIGISADWQMLNSIREHFCRLEKVDRFLTRARTEGKLEISGLAGSASALLLAELFERQEKTILIVVPTEKFAGGIAGELRELCGEQKVSHFSAWGVSPYDMLVPPVENVAQRISTVWRLAWGERQLVVTSPEALIEPTIDRESLKDGCFKLQLEGEYDLTEIATRLEQIGYERTVLTEEVGTVWLSLRTSRRRPDQKDRR